MNIGSLLNIGKAGEAAGKAKEAVKGAKNGAKMAWNAGPIENTKLGSKIITRSTNKLDGVIAKQGYKAGAKTAEELVEKGSKTFLGRIANAGKGILGKVAKISTRIPLLGALIGAAFEIDDVAQARKEGRTIAQVADSGCKVAGMAGGATVGAAIGSAILPVGGTILGAIIGGLIGEHIGDSVGDIPAGVATALGLSAKKKPAQSQQPVADVTPQGQPSDIIQQLAKMEQIYGNPVSNLGVDPYMMPQQNYLNN